MTTQLNTLHIGIDAHSRNNVVCFLDQAGNVVNKAFSFENNLPGAQKLEDAVCAFMATGKYDSLKIATEAVSLYHIPLLDFLSASKKLAQYEIEIFQLNPKIVKGFKKIYADKNKTDKDDAFVIADRLRIGRLPKPYYHNEPYAPIRRLTRYRCHLVESISREKNYFLLHLFLKYSSFSALKPFSNTFGKASLAIILEEISLDDLAKKPMEDLVDFICAHGRNHFEDPHQIAEKVKQVARESYRIRPALANSINLILTTSWHNIKTMATALKDVNKAIAVELQGFPNTLESVKGLGPVYSAGIIAEIGSIKNFASHNALAKFAGLTWRQNESSNFKAEITKMTKTGNKHLRYYLLEAANLLRVHNKIYADYYASKLREVKSHRHKRAVALTARKLVRLVFSLLKNQQLYQPSRESRCQ